APAEVRDRPGGGGSAAAAGGARRREGSGAPPVRRGVGGAAIVHGAEGMMQAPLTYESGRKVKESSDFSRQHQALLVSATGRPVAGALHLVSKSHESSYDGAWQVPKDSAYDAESFMDYMMRPEQLV